MKRSVGGEWWLAEVAPSSPLSDVAASAATSPLATPVAPEALARTSSAAAAWGEPIETPTQAEPAPVGG